MERILVVEDEVTTRFLIVKILQMAGYQTCEAENGQQALEILQYEYPVDLIITDILMNGLNGLQLLKESRKRYPTLPVMILTVFTRPDWIREAMQNGAVYYLVKPFTRQQLTTVVGDVLDSTSPREDHFEQILLPCV